MSIYLCWPQYRMPRLDTKWQEQAICVETDPETFFPSKGDRRGVRAAKRVCDQCPVKQECLEYALEFGAWNLPGIWGGLSERQRREIARERRKASA